MVLMAAMLLAAALVCGACDGKASGEANAAVVAKNTAADGQGATANGPGASPGGVGDAGEPGASGSVTVGGDGGGAAGGEGATAGEGATGDGAVVSLNVEPGSWGDAGGGGAAGDSGGAAGDADATGRPDPAFPGAGADGADGQAQASSGVSFDESERSGVRFVTGDGVFMRAAPVSGAALGSFNKGAQLTYYGDENGWGKVGDGSRYGYIRGDFLSEDNPLATGDGETAGGATATAGDGQDSDGQADGDGTGAGENGAGTDGGTATVQTVGANGAGGTTAAASGGASGASGGKKVAIDPGHQRKGNSATEPVGPGSSEKKAKVSSGTSGAVTGVPEYQLNLDVSLQLKTELLARGYEVYMIRETNDIDISNIERAQAAANAGSDILVRIHANSSSDSSVHGLLTIAPTKSNPYMGAMIAPSKLLSDLVLAEAVKATGAKNRGVWETDTMSGINWSTIPVTIVEMGFMSNPDEDRLMQTADYQAKMVQGIANGIDAYFAQAR
jgi:N-acetylmuramoyl-L-alanine amidase